MTKPIDTKTSGGNAKIMIQRVLLEYEHRGDALFRSSSQALTFAKYLAIKVPNCNSELGLFNFRKKTAHELSILQKLKDAETNFIVKHYVSRDPSYPFHGHVMSDLIVDPHNPNPTLNSLLLCRAPSMSIQSKAYLITGIANGLKVLHSRRIVHMDLSPKNFMVTNFVPMLIDFGESYHSDLCDSSICLLIQPTTPAEPFHSPAPSPAKASRSSTRPQTCTSSAS